MSLSPYSLIHRDGRPPGCPPAQGSSWMGVVQALSYMGLHSMVCREGYTRSALSGWEDQVYMRLF